MRPQTHSAPLLLATLVVCFTVAGFAQDAGVSEAVSHAVGNADRPPSDREDDSARKPGEVLSFFGIEPGMDVLDLLGGGGYYTEIAARTVGAEGSVLFHNNQAYLSFLGEAVTERIAGDRLSNVTPLNAEVDDLEIAADSLDAAIFVLGYHDIYFKDTGWNPIDPARLLGKLFAALRPGGVLGVVDHAAANGSDPWDAGTNLHRIDEAYVTREIEAAGFTLESTSDLLRNPEDDRTVLVFDPSMRRKTDRFILRFRRP